MCVPRLSILYDYLEITQYFYTSFLSTFRVSCAFDLMNKKKYQRTIYKAWGNLKGNLSSETLDFKVTYFLYRRMKYLKRRGNKQKNT